MILDIEELDKFDIGKKYIGYFECPTNVRNQPSPVKSIVMTCAYVDYHGRQVYFDDFPNDKSNKNIRWTSAWFVKIEPYKETEEMKYNGKTVKECTEWNNIPHDMIVWNNTKQVKIAQVIYYNKPNWITLGSNGNPAVYEHAAELPESDIEQLDCFNVNTLNGQMLVYPAEQVEPLLEELKCWRAGKYKPGFSEVDTEPICNDNMSSEKYTIGKVYKCWVNKEDNCSAIICICDSVDNMTGKAVFRDVTNDTPYYENELSLIRAVYDE